MDSLLKTPGIVIKSVKYGDHAMIVTLYTREKGIQSFWFRRKIGDQKIKALVAPLAQLQVIARIRHHETIYSPIEVTQTIPYVSLFQDPVKSSMVLFLSEWLKKVLKEEEHNHPLFDFLTTSLNEMDRPGQLHPSFHLSFLLHLTRYLGFLPDTDTYHTGYSFCAEEGIFKPEHLLQYVSSSVETGQRLYELSGISFDQYQQFRADKDTRNLLLDLLIHYYRIHIPGFGELKTLPVIRTLF